MRTQTRTVVIVLALSALVALAGCADSGPADGPGDGPSADVIQDQATAAMQNVSTAAFTMDMSVDSSQGSLSLTSDGVMDIPNKRMRMNMTLESRGRTVELTQYIIDQTAYQQVQGRWRTTDMSGQNVWAEGNQLNVQGQMLANSTLNVTGTDTVEGNEVWVVAIEPSDASIQKFLSGTGTGVTENMDIDSVSLTQYVDTDSYHVRKLELTMDMTMQDQSGTLEMVMTFSRFGEAVDIELPDAATQ
jgi:predicted small lipoprotein YifL